MRDGWIETTLGEIADYQNGYAFKPADLGSQGLPVIRIKQLLNPDEPVDRSTTQIPEKQHIHDGDLIFTWSGTLAVRRWDRGPALLNQHLFRVTERDGVSRDWLLLALDHAIDGLSELTHGTTMKHITKGKLVKYPVLLPPLAEQKRIVDVVMGTQRLRDEAQTVATMAEKARQSLMAELLSGAHAIPESYDAMFEHLS